MIELTWSEFKDRFDSSVRKKLAALLDESGTDALVMFENVALDSSAFGDRTAIAIGPERTYKTLEECQKGHLNDLPSRRQYATAYVLKTSLTQPEDAVPAKAVEKAQYASVPTAAQT